MEAILLTITLISFATAVGACVLAWRVMRAERLRSDARIAALAADLGVDEAERTIPLRAPAVAADLPIHHEPVVAPQAMFASRQRGRSAGRAIAGVGVAALVVAVVIGSLVITSDRTPTAASRHPGAPAAAALTEVPLELIALGHEREADRLTVRGVVRGASAAEQGPLTAVVLLFNREGTQIGTGRADVQPSGMDPAAERTFVVTVPSAGDVGRYRISFRSDDHIVPHIDKRAVPGTGKPDVLSVKSDVKSQA